MPPRVRTDGLGRAHCAACRERHRGGALRQGFPAVRSALVVPDDWGGTKPESLAVLCRPPLAAVAHAMHGTCLLFGGSPPAGDAVAVAAAPRLRQLDGGLQGGRGHLR